MFSDLSIVQTSNSSFAPDYESSSNKSSSYHSVGVFAARRDIKNRRSFGTALNESIDQRTRDYLRSASRRRRRSSSPITASNRNQQPFRRNYDGAASNEILDQRALIYSHYAHSRRYNNRRSSGARSFLNNRRNHQPSSNTSGAIVDKRDRRSSRNASRRRRSSSPISAGNRNQQPLRRNYDDAAEVKIVDQRPRVYSRYTNWRRSNYRRSSGGPSHYRNFQPLCYSVDGATLNQLVDQFANHNLRNTTWREPYDGGDLDGPICASEQMIKQPETESFDARMNAMAEALSALRIDDFQMDYALEVVSLSRRFELEEMEPMQANVSEKKQEKLLEEIHLQADAAEERKKIQAIIEQIQKEAQMRKEEHEQFEKEHLLKEKLRKEEQERQLKKEKVEGLQQERERQEKLLLHQESCQFGQCIATHGSYSTISKQKLLDYPHEHSSSEEVERRVQLSIDFEELASEEMDELSRSEEEVNESVWVKQAFAENIFSRVHDKVIYENKINPKDYKTEWQLFISTPEKNGTSYDWFKRKFDLDDDFCRNVTRYKQFDVGMRMVTPEADLGAKWALDAGAIVFDLPNYGSIRNKEDRQLYWAECRKRLDDLTRKIQKYSSRKFPILFTYFGGQADTKETLEQIPELLDLGRNSMVKDYHFLIMNPKTIKVRIVNEINWLAINSE